MIALRTSGLPVWRRGFPFFLARPRTAIERLRAASARQVRTEGPLWRRVALSGAMTLGWPIVALVDAVKTAADAARGASPSFADLYAAALTRNIPPAQFARYAALGDSDAQLADFLLPLDVRGLHRLSTARGAVLGDVQNKARFGQICRAHGLPCVPTLASFLHGAAEGEDKLRAWPGSFFVKSLTANRGAGAEKWMRHGSDFVSSGGRELAIEAIIAELHSQNCIVQPLLEDAPELKALGSSALSSIRIITVAGQKIPPAAIAATLNFPNRPQSVTSNEGALCGIDIADGTIVKIFTPRDAELAAADSKLLGVALPFWRESVDLVCRAHEIAFRKFVSLGWDVALTSEGPILIETNLNWGVSPHQLLTGPLGKTRLSDVIDELLSAPPQDRRSASRRQ